MADEYIRRDAAMKAVASQYGACRSPAQNRLLDEIRNKIRRMPAADVAEVVQGQWEEYLIPHILCCSNCDWGIDPLDKSPYCPHCGAEMSEAK